MATLTGFEMLGRLGINEAFDDAAVVVLRAELGRGQPHQ